MAREHSRKNNPQANMELKEHIREFKNRVIKSAVATLLTTIAGFFLYMPFIEAISVPIQELQKEGRLASLNYDTIQSGFGLLVSVSLYIGIALASPVWLYQLWAFITPALYKKERRYALGFIFSAVPMFVLGLIVAWYSFPGVVTAFTSFTPTNGTNVMTAEIYISFLVKFMLSFALAFVTPVILVGLNFIGLLSGKTVLKSWRWVVIFIATISAATAPGNDVATMFYLAAPLIVFFFIAILICLWSDKRRAKKQAKLAQGLTDEELNRATSAEELERLGREEPTTQE
ncbi:twin-arginine translocase subunit TatC [Rothia sp. P6271]|uniref:twin-arginine translocase subunit TatC n=1 Tax=unclassified Rothia (in: high G+C Gram-positive bacteria) TaxID=2689056 RepID=UPI003AD683F3